MCAVIKGRSDQSFQRNYYSLLNNNRFRPEKTIHFKISNISKYL